MVSETVPSLEVYDSGTPRNIFIPKGQNLGMEDCNLALLAAFKLAFEFLNFQVYPEAHNINRYIKKHPVHKHLLLKNVAIIYKVYSTTDSTEQ